MSFILKQEFTVKPFDVIYIIEDAATREETSVTFSLKYGADLPEDALDSYANLERKMKALESLRKKNKNNAPTNEEVRVFRAYSQHLKKYALVNKNMEAAWDLITITDRAKIIDAFRSWEDETAARLKKEHEKK